MADETNHGVGLSYAAGAAEGAAADEDAGLVALSQKGDLGAFERLVTRHQKRMLNIALRITGEYEDACEIAQDAFVSAYRNIAGFRGDAKFTTWLTAIVVNLSRNRLKRTGARKGREAFSLDAPVRSGDKERMPDPPSREPSALDRVEQQDIRKRVQDCVQALEPDYREVLVLRDLQEFSYEEIGAALGIRGGTVKSRLFRARESVKDCLKRIWGEL
jgi:RNA polymerase sigma-70 factor, ECF subfamily